LPGASIDRYVDPALLERERAALFRKQPIIVAHESELPATGDFVTEDVAGVPLLILRDAGGQVRVFVNVCSHRDVQLVYASRGCGQEAFTCVYHAWRYGLDGSLGYMPGEEVFGRGLDRTGRGLRPVPHAVRHGFVWVRLDGDFDRSVDIPGFLGPVLDDDFTCFELATHRVHRATVHVASANWKLVMDAFAGGRHATSLHRQSPERASVVDDCAPHVRQVAAREGAPALAGQPEASWDLRAHATVLYNVFPAAVLVFHPLWIAQIGLFPEAVDRVRVVHRMLVPHALTEAAASDAERERRDESFARIDGQVLAGEDLAMTESIQSTLRSGANHAVLLDEPKQGMRLFHDAWDRAMRAP
jgi:phenylpropionate dioxygenase-like ring-hydroxylating dioxygenase large terminal subunit